MNDTLIGTKGNYKIEQVGKRWFIVHRVIEVSGRRFEAWKCEASYTISNYDEKEKRWSKNRKWTLTGKGSRAYREGIVKALEDYLKAGESHE